MRAHPRQSKAFTLVEAVLVLAILASLATLLTPAAGSLTERARALSCVSNLRQIGIAATLYANDHDQSLPKIEAWPSNPIYTAEDNTLGLKEALEPYGITEVTLKCSTDIKGPNYYKTEGSSYEWCPMANGQNVQAVKATWGGPQGEDTIPLSRLLLAFDYSGVHNGGYNILFGDGHVSAAE